MIMQDSSFLIRGAWIMETGCFSLVHEFLGHLYYLINWKGGFSSGLRPVYFGMVGSHYGLSFLVGSMPQLPS